MGGGRGEAGSGKQLAGLFRNSPRASFKKREEKKPDGGGERTACCGYDRPRGTPRRLPASLSQGASLWPACPSVPPSPAPVAPHPGPRPLLHAPKPQAAFVCCNPYKKNDGFELLTLPQKAETKRPPARTPLGPAGRKRGFLAPCPHTNLQEGAATVGGGRSNQIWAQAQFLEEGGQGGEILQRAAPRQRHRPHGCRGPGCAHLSALTRRAGC